MKQYTQQEIDDLIRCPKVVTEAPRPSFKDEYRHRSNGFRVATSDGEHRFRVFLRQSLEFVEDFSIGLLYEPKDGRSFLLVRFNGQHDIAIEGDDVRTHFTYHVHLAEAGRVNNGFYDSLPARTTGDYASFNEALEAFFLRTGIPEPEKYFPDRVSLPLFRPREP